MSQSLEYHLQFERNLDNVHNLCDIVNSNLLSFGVDLGNVNLSDTFVLETMLAIDENKGKGPDNIPPLFIKKSVRFPLQRH